VPLTTGEFLQGRYRIVARMGQGGMGAVYRAWDTRLDVAVALKEMVPQFGLSSQKLTELTQQFQREARVLARLDHPHLVRVSDYFQEDGNAYLVMDFIQGESLAQRIQQQGALAESDVLEWAEQLLSALAYCHSQGILHRDVKPHNVIIRSDGQAVLVDFGLVKLWDPRAPRTQTAIRSMGTPEYAPPEQYDDRLGHTDPRSDIYSLGGTLYHALTGRAPETATTRMAAPERFEPIRSLAPNVSRRTQKAVMKALELVKSKRWADANEMAEALEVSTPTAPSQPFEPVVHSVVPSVPPAAGPPAPGPTVPVPPAAGIGRRIPGWAWAVGGLLVLALALGAAAVVISISRGLIGPGASATPQQVAGVNVPVTETPTMVTPSATPTAKPTGTDEPTPSPTAKGSPTATPSRGTTTPTRDATSSAGVTPTSSRAPTVAPTAAGPSPTPGPTSPPVSGALFTFEEGVGWRRGDQPYGELTQAQSQAHTGSASAELSYDFPVTEDDFVVFVRQVSLAGQPDTVGAWVYGDGSGHYLNSWIEDAQGEIWSVHLGRIGGTGWQQLAGRLDPDRAWPSGHVAGPQNGVVDYPIRFYGVALDRAGTGPQTGRIYLDDISIWRSTAGATATSPPPVTEAAPGGDVTPTATDVPQTSGGPLDFVEPTMLDNWARVEGKTYNCTIVVRIQGGAPPFKVYHEVQLAGTTDQREYPLVFKCQGSKVTGTITVESGDGQTVAHDYWINTPWEQ